jgi:hypothetical protein
MMKTLEAHGLYVCGSMNRNHEACHGHRVLFWMGDPNSNQRRGSLVLRHHIYMNNKLLVIWSNQNRFSFTEVKLK